MNIQEQIDSLREPVAYGPVGSQKEREKAADTLEKLYKVYLAADRHKDNPMNLALHIKLIKAIKAVQESE